LDDRTQSVYPVRTPTNISADGGPVGEGSLLGNNTRVRLEVVTRHCTIDHVAVWAGLIDRVIQ